MKRLLLLPVLAIAMLGFSAAPASAAGCTGANVGLVGRSAYPVPAWFHFPFTLSGCSGVDRIRVYTSVNQSTEIIDYTSGQVIGPYIVNGSTSFSNPQVAYLTTPFTAITVNFEFGCWFADQRYLGGEVGYAVHNQAANTWGQDHWKGGSNVLIQGC